MERNREARRLTLASSANGLSRRRHRAGSLRDSPEDDGPVELAETARLRDRGGSLKKDRDRDRDREKERERERDWSSSRSKRRRGDKLMHGGCGIREDSGGESSEESVDDEEEEDGDDGNGGAPPLSSLRTIPPNNMLFPSSSLPNNHHHHQISSSNLQHRKSYPPPTKVFRASPTVTASTSTWKPADEMIGMLVPRKARSASVKRPHESWASSAGGVVASGEQVHRQTSTSPVRASPATMFSSPSSSNVSLRKKMANGPKPRPPKSSSKSSSSGQDEIEIEIAEVLYGMMRQPLGPSKQETSENDSRKANKSSGHYNATGDSKLSLSPLISNSQSMLPHTTSTITANSAVSAIAPKRKRPRPLKYEEDNPSVFPPRPTATKAEADQLVKTEGSLANLERNLGSAAENGHISFDLMNSQTVPSTAESPQPETVRPESFPVPAPKHFSKDLKSTQGGVAKDERQLPVKDCKSGSRLDDASDNTSETKANPIASEVEKQLEEKLQIDLMAPPLKSSPTRGGEIEVVAVDPKPNVSALELHEENVKEDEKAVKNICKDDVSFEPEENKSETIVEKADLRLDLEKTDIDSGNKLNSRSQKQQPQQHSTEKIVQPTSHPLPLSMAGWPGALAPMGYMAPLQGVVPMDGSALSSTVMQPPHMLFNQPRPKRCATHCYIARNILYHQQFTKMNPFWAATAGSAPLCGAKQCNLNSTPASELQSGILGRGMNSVQDKSQSAMNISDTAQRKQILLQPGAAPSNILHGPAIIFPLSQQHPATAASVRPGSVKSPPVTDNNTTAPSSNSASVSSPASTIAAVAPLPGMSFNYPIVPPGNETQYLAIVQNNAYPFPIPAHTGAPLAYRGGPTQAIPFFNGSFYSSQMLHPLHLQQQQQQPQQSKQHQGHQNPSSISSGSSAPHKQMQNQPHRAPGMNDEKNQSFQSQQFQQRERDTGSKDILSSTGTETRVFPTNMGIYGQNFVMPMQPPNLGLMTTSRSAINHGEKKQQQQQQTHQHQGSKPGVEPLSSQAFAVSFASMNGTANAPPGFDISSIVQNHAILNSLPEAARQGYHQMMQAAVTAQSEQQKKNPRASEDLKPGTNNNNNNNSETGKSSSTSCQSIAFSRPDLTSVIDSSACALNLGSAPPRSSGSVNFNPPTSNQQLQKQQIMQFQKQQQFAAAAAATAARNKVLPTSNGSVTFSSMSGFPQKIVQNSGSPGQSPQWKNSARINTAQVPSPSLSPSSLKNIPQQQGRSQQTHSMTQISFGVNPKTSSIPQVAQQGPSSNQSPSSPTVVGSPSTSSISKSTGGSPKTTASTSMGIKNFQASSTLSSLPSKNSPSVQTQKSSSASGRNIPSILGNPHASSASSTVTKTQLSQQHQHLTKRSLQQAQLFFSGAYMQPTTTSTTSTSGYHLQRHRNVLQHQQQPTGSNSTSSTEMLSLSASANNNSTSDPAKALTATPFTAVQSKTHELVHAGFSYVRAAPTTVQVKPAEQNQPGE